MSRQGRLNLAMLLAGLGSFSLMYACQPVLPMLAQSFALDATAASLAVTLTTGPLAVFILIAGLIGDRFDKRRLMIASITLAAALTVACGLAPNWSMLLILRVAIGLAIAGVPAVAMSYLAQESGQAALGPAMGIYVAGTAVGGMSGRLATGLIAEFLGWRWGLSLLGCAALLLALAFALTLPRPLKPQSGHGFGLRATLTAGADRMSALVRDRVLGLLVLQAFLFMGAFVTLYNYAGFRLEQPPFNFSPAQIGLIFALYLLGSLSSWVVGQLSARHPRAWLSAGSLLVLLAGAGLTLTTSTGLFVTGVALVTLGFFGAHSLASGWVGARSVALGGGGAALYLFFYYLGASVLSTLGGYGWEHGAWPGVVGYVAALCLTALGLTPLLARAERSAARTA